MNNSYNRLIHVSWIIAMIVRQLVSSSANIVLGQLYKGSYVATQEGKTFNYLQGRSGDLIAQFYGHPNRQALNSVDLYLMDPVYKDQKVVLFQLKNIIEVNENGIWTGSNHSAQFTTIWKDRQQQLFFCQNVNSTISFQNLESQDYHQVTFSIYIQGPEFQFTTHLSYYNQIVSTFGYSFYIGVVVGLQILCGMRLLKDIQLQNQLMVKISLLTLSLCSIADFSSALTHIQYILGSQSGYLFFVLPSAAFIILFIMYDMKMLFLVWKNQNIRIIQNPQQLRKRLTTFYIQFYLGLFLFLTLNYFFVNDQWMIILRNLTLLPQVIHNLRIGNKPEFNLFFIVGFAGSRILVPLYERICPQNRFSLSPNLYLAFILIAIYLIEILLLFLQFKLGSRFFVPKRFLPNHHEYRLKIIQNEISRQIECTICLQNIFTKQPRALSECSSITEQLLNETIILNTPCGHKFHFDCLTQWLDVKMECPTCRAQLPPF